MFYVRLYRAGVFDDEKFILNEDSLAQMTISIKENQEKKQRLTEKKTRNLHFRIQISKKLWLYDSSGIIDF